MLFQIQQRLPTIVTVSRRKFLMKKSPMRCLSITSNRIAKLFFYLRILLHDPSKMRLLVIESCRR